MKITERKELIDRVFDNYNADTVMLNKFDFDFDVEMEITDILDCYVHIQQVVNGDKVVIPTHSPLRGKYVGNCMELLEWFGKIRGFKRITEDREEVDFIF